MKKISLLFLLGFTAGLFLLFNHVTAVFAHSTWVAENHVRPSYQWVEPEKLHLASSSAYTFYISAIFYDYPPPSPKKGVGIVAPPACTDMQALRASWHFNWGTYPDQSCSGFEANFVPRISSDTEAFPQAIAYAQASGWLIGFSEPNLPWWDNISPTQGAILWKQVEDAVSGTGIKLVSPAPNQYAPGQADPYGHQWTWAMVDEYRVLYGKNPRFDAMGWHIYGWNAEDMKNYLIARRNEGLARGYDVPIWVLEYGGCLTSNSQASDRQVMETLTPWFNSTPWIERYAWFSNRGADYIGYHECVLINTTNTLTLLGQIYHGF